MKRKNWLGACLFALFSLLFKQGVHAKSQEFTCGNSLQTNLIKAGGLAKASDLPKTTKVWSGKRKALVFRISFSDSAYAIDTSMMNSTHTTINSLFASMSRNTFQWDFQIFPKILVAPSKAAIYEKNFSLLQSWIPEQIKAAGLKQGIDYDVYIATFPQITVGWGGISNMQDANWINGNYSTGVIAHELGHSLGLPHAHSIEAGTDMFGIPGTPTQTNEYGNPFDVMGHGGSEGHFNVLYKLRVGWQEPEEVKEINTSGIYRIYAHDNAVHKSRLVGIRVPSANPNYAYWFEYRTLSNSARLGATVIFQGFKSPTSLDAWYVDTTPGSNANSDENDGILMPGRQIMDKYGDMIIKTLAINANTWTEEGWVDLQVTIPTTKTIQPVISYLKDNAFGNLSTALYLNGRTLKGHSKQKLFLKNEFGKLELTYQAWH
jgi:hypothetical protein